MARMDIHIQNLLIKNLSISALICTNFGTDGNIFKIESAQNENDLGNDFSFQRDEYNHNPSYQSIADFGYHDKDSFYIGNYDSGQHYTSQSNKFNNQNGVNYSSQQENQKKIHYEQNKWEASSNKGSFLNLKIFNKFCCSNNDIVTTSDDVVLKDLKIASNVENRINLQCKTRNNRSFQASQNYADHSNSHNYQLWNNNQYQYIENYCKNRSSNNYGTLDELRETKTSSYAWGKYYKKVKQNDSLDEDEIGVNNTKTIVNYDADWSILTSTVEGMRNNNLENYKSIKKPENLDQKINKKKVESTGQRTKLKNLRQANNNSSNKYNEGEETEAKRRCGTTKFAAKHEWCGVARVAEYKSEWDLMEIERNASGQRDDRWYDHRGDELEVQNHQFDSSISHSTNANENIKNGSNLIASTNGQSRVKLPEVLLENGNVYTGEWSDAHMHGFGTMLFKNGWKYSGDWIMGKATGHCIFEEKNGDYYEGYVVESKAQGRGVYKYASGLVYEGEWFENRYHGNGVEFWPDGTRINAVYKNGVKNGTGTWHFSDNSTFKGEFQDDNITGFGEYNYWDGKRYVGNFLNGKMHGIGRHTWPDGRVYKGSYDQDKKHGYGEFWYSDGKVYKGQWFEGRQNGQGVLIKSDGTMRKGLWSCGKLIINNDD